MDLDRPNEKDVAHIHQSLAELGWSTAMVEQALTLPLGPKELQEKVRALLRPSVRFSSDFLNKNRDVCIFYAVRAGEDPRNIPL